MNSRKKKEDCRRFFYQFDNFVEESETWFEIWANRCRDGMATDDMNLIEVCNHTAFLLSVRTALQTALALPVTACSIERSFSTLRRVKTWLRSTTENDHLSGLCMMSVHWAKIDKDKRKFLDCVINRFGQEPRRLQFSFHEQAEHD
jgi:hypothetical protein